MKRSTRWALIGGLLLVPLASWQVWALGQDASRSFTVDGGGDRSTGGDFALHGTTGQPDAGTMEGAGGYGIRGGFWHTSVQRATSAGESPLLIRHELAEPAPNPFNPRTSLSFELAQAARVQLEVLDVRGRRVRRLVEGIRPAGSHSITWEGRADDGSIVASGVYYLRLIADGQIRTRKMTLLK